MTISESTLTDRLLPLQVLAKAKFFVRIGPTGAEPMPSYYEAEKEAVLFPTPPFSPSLSHSMWQRA